MSPEASLDMGRACVGAVYSGYKDNHGEYVSGAAHAGIKGKDLVAIAQDTTPVGPYKG